MLRVIVWLLVLFALQRQSSCQLEQTLSADLDALIRQGKAKDALSVLESLSDEIRAEPTARILTARALLQLGDKDKGEQILQSVVEADELNVEARVVLGKFYVFQQQWQVALRLLQQALHLDPGNASALVFMSKCLAQAGEADKAQALIIKAATLAPNDENIQFELGINHLTHGKPFLAKQAFETAAKLNPKLDRATLAKVYMHFKQIEWAVVELEQVASKIVSKTMSSSPGDSGADVVSESEMTSLLLLAESYDMVGLPAEAQDMYSYVLTIEPSNVLANTGLGLLLLGTGTRNFAALEACGINQQIAVHHLTLAVKSQQARGQTPSAIRNAQDIAEKALAFCRLQNASVENWASLCRDKSLAAAATVPAGHSVLTDFANTLARFRQNIIEEIFKMLGSAMQAAGLCPSWVQKISSLKAWSALCRRQTADTAAHVAKSDAPLLSKDESFLQKDVTDTAKIAAMKSKWRSREGIPSVAKIAIVAEKSRSTGRDGVQEMTAAEFMQRHVLQNKPAVLTNLQDEWGGEDDFSIAGLVKAFGNKTVTVSISQHGRFDGPEDGSLWGLDSGTDVLVRPPTTSMQLADFMALLPGDSSSRLKVDSSATYYLEYLALNQYLGPDFLALVPLPEHLLALTKPRNHPERGDRLAPLVTNLWIGGTPTISPLHYDDYENLLAQIRGNKELLLFPPSDVKNLYYVGRPKGTLKFEYPATFDRDKSSVDKRAFVFGSSVNVDDPDTARHPLYAKASPLRVILHPGDVLYLPAFWHHEVQSIPEPDTSMGPGKRINVAVNFWFANMTRPNEAM